MNSWVTDDLTRCYQVMECDNRALLDAWLAAWSDLVAFEVHPQANKIEIKRAVEKQFNVRVAEVRVARMHGKVRRQGRYVGQRPDWKKAYVRIQEGQIEFFEGV